MSNAFSNFDLQFFDDTGVNPVSGGKLYFYSAGTSTPKNTYPTFADAEALTNANPNPVTLDSAGRPYNGGAIQLFGTSSGSYKVVLKDADLVTIRTWDNFSLIPGNTTGLTEILEDTSPQLGGDLDANTFDIQFDNNTGIRDDSDNEQLIFGKTASAVNYVTITNSATGNRPSIAAAGDDTNIGLTISPKGTGNISLGTVVLDGDQTVGAGQDNYVLTYDHGTGLVALEASTGGLNNVVEDLTPQLGGSLDVNGQKIVSVSNGNIDIEPHGTGNVLLGNFVFNADQTIGAGEDNYVVTYDHATGLLNLEVAPGAGGGISNVVEDATPQLGGNLDVNGYDITSPDGTDLIDIVNGTITVQTASTSRVDITDSGVRLGAANARVTTILDEDAMTSDSATALATQQSIKAYVDAQALTGYLLKSVQTFTATGANTWTKPSGIDYVVVFCHGAGGGGGGSNAGATTTSSGGGGGGLAIELIDVTGTSSETATVGAGGTGGTAGNNGTGGGTSSFGAYCSATGGAGGKTDKSSASGGVGSGGNCNLAGNASAGWFDGVAAGGPGGGGVWGGGAGGKNGAGNNASGIGGGGSGSLNSTAGGNGGDGIIYVMEYEAQP